MGAFLAVGGASYDVLDSNAGPRSAPSFALVHTGTIKTTSTHVYSAPAAVRHFPVSA